MSETIKTVQGYLAHHRLTRARLRKELADVDQQIKTCEEWIEELKRKSTRGKEPR